MKPRSWRSETGMVVEDHDNVRHAAIDGPREACHPYHDPWKPCKPECVRISYVPLPKDGYPWTMLDDAVERSTYDVKHRSENPLPVYAEADILIESRTGNLFRWPHAVFDGQRKDGEMLVRYSRMHVPTHTISPCPSAPYCMPCPSIEFSIHKQ